MYAVRLYIQLRGEAGSNLVFKNFDGKNNERWLCQEAIHTTPNDK